MRGKGDVADTGKGHAVLLLRRLVRPHLPGLALALLLMTLQSASGLILPWLAGKLSTRLLQGDATGPLLWALFALVLGQAVLGYMVTIRLRTISGRLVADASTHVYEHLQALPLAWHNERQRGDVLSLVTSDVYRLGEYVTTSLVPLLPLLLTFFGALAVMMGMAPVVGVAIAVLMPALFIALRLAGRRMRPLGHQVMHAWAARSALTEQNLALLPVIKSYATDDYEARRFRQSTDILYESEIRQAQWSEAINPLVRVLSIGVILLLLGYAGGSIAKGALAPGQLVSLFLYGLVLVQPVSQLARLYGDTMSTRGSLQRLSETLAADPEQDTGIRVLETAQGEVRFDDVHFAYAGRAPLFRGLDLHVRAGETVALTGHNGAGKTTLVHLLQRLVEPQSGRITIDGVDVREFSLVSLRSAIGLVSQNVLLFNASVAENIAYGHAGATREDIERAAVAARAHDFVMALPQGYATVIGDQGVKLSGGQKQRISLARALLKDPAILILDEATAMFDPEGEQEFIAECHELLRQRTVMLITHRPASLALADRVLRLQDGVLETVR
jgi:ABC-type multidrug transport system fused ATPase/permease subunit